jgi:hypothetical protein
MRAFGLYPGIVNAHGKKFVNAGASRGTPMQAHIPHRCRTAAFVKSCATSADLFAELHIASPSPQLPLLCELLLGGQR